MVKKITQNFYLSLFLIGFAINLVWEVTQMRYFAVLPGTGYSNTVLFCSLASVIDGLAVISIYFVVSKFIKPKTLLFYVAAAGGGAICAVIFEVFALKLGFWSYQNTMPKIPFIGIGALPFFQLVILVPVCILLANKFSIGNSNRA